MSDVAFNGDHCSAALARAPAQADKYASPCINEAGNKLCNSVKCWYTHSKPTSKNFGKTKPGTKQGGPQGNNHQQGTRSGGSGGHNGGPRAPHDHRLNSNQHNLQRILAQVAQQSQQPSGIPTEVWARGVQRPAIPPNPQPAQQVQRNASQNGGGAHNMTCYGCGQVGHYSNMCPNKANNHGNNRGGGDASNVTCYDCHEIGHYKSQCPNKGGNQGNNQGERFDGKCRRCKQVGHREAQCSQPANQFGATSRVYFGGDSQAQQVQDQFAQPQYVQYQYAESMV